ncbi:MAG: hypothetical protein GXX89_05920 [Clostridiales bacterium]|jgi:hypothetical protein|nr:hypothetical protein [Clostridiales bacterium]
MKRLLTAALAAALALTYAACGGIAVTPPGNAESGKPAVPDLTDGRKQSSGAPDTDYRLELVESGYALTEGPDRFYVRYALVVKNPGADRAVLYPTVRITARDADGAVLGTEDIVGSSILPGETWYSAFQGPGVDSTPATVEFEIVQPEGFHWISPELIDYAGEPLTVINPVRRSDKIVGEIANPNSFNIDSAAVVVLFRDDGGKLLAGETAYTDKVAASGSIPFEVWLPGEESCVTDNFEVHAYPWY